MLAVTVVVSLTCNFAGEPGQQLFELLLLNKPLVAAGELWRLVTVTLTHAPIQVMPLHLLFNMYFLYLAGPFVERLYGRWTFLLMYVVFAIGGSLTSFALTSPPDSPLAVGASGAIYGVLLAYALYFPNRPIYMYLVFPIPAKYFVMIIGGISLLSAMSGPGSGVAHTTHLGGLVAGYLYLKSGRMHLIPEIKYRFLKWRINRMRRRFDVYSGGRADDVDRRVH